MTTTIILADDHKIVRDGLRTLIEEEPDMKIVAEAENGKDTVKLAKELIPDVIIMDITMPDINGIDATRDIIRDIPGVKIVALSMYSDRRFVMGMLEAGAKGYLLKECAFDELPRAVRTVMSHETYLCPEVADIIIDRFVRNSISKEFLSPSVLTRREREVLQVLAGGMTTREAAEHLNVNIKTVETHRRKIMKKLRVHNVKDLIKYAIREGLATQ